MIKSSLNKVNLNGSLCFITFPPFSQFPHLSHAFSTRLGGKSTGHFAQMNLSFNVGDNRETVIENYNIFCDAVGLDVNTLVLSRQTHSNAVRVVTRADLGKGIFREYDYTDADALVTNEKGITLVTHSADCCLLGFYDPNKHVIASAHAGWRGTVAEIAAKTVESMVQNFGCDKKDIIVCIAPSIGKCCYEVDEPLYTAFSKLHYIELSKIFTPKGNGKYMLDLWEANRIILLNAGIRDTNIHITDICTNCNGEQLHSHRASHGKRGINALFMSMK